MNKHVNISGDTKIVFIIADPISHVKTPEMLNEYFYTHNIGAVVVPAWVHKQDLTGVINGLRYLQNLAGIIVTVPHKIDIINLCDSLDKSARVAGAVNIIKRTDDNEFIGANYDGKGLVDSISNEIGPVIDKSVYISGAGGVARAIAFAFAIAGVKKISIHNRTEIKAKNLVDAIKAFKPDIDVSVNGTHPKGFDIAINATTVGMDSDDRIPFFLDSLDTKCLIADVIMQPKITRLLQEAKARGHKINTGDGMLKCQLNNFANYLGLLEIN